VIIVFVTYFPLICILGGFDDYQLFVFKKALEISGPSKPIFGFIYKLMLKSVEIARKLGTHGRFPIPYEEAHHEIRQLMELKRANVKAKII
jgi:hypothetical protein